MNPDTLLQAVQPAQSNFGIEVAKLLLFSIFVTASLEVIKEAYKRFSPSGINEQTTKILNFALALLFCWAFDYGVMMRIVEAGVKARVGISGWLDYVATSSMIYMGADWIFAKFSASVEKARAIKTAALNGGVK